MNPFWNERKTNICLIPEIFLDNNEEYKKIISRIKKELEGEFRESETYIDENGNEVPTPKYMHSLNVAKSIIKYSGLTGDDLDLAIKSALLHDALEDIDDINEGFLKKEYGEKIAKIVSLLTNAKGEKEKDDNSKKNRLTETLKEIEDEKDEENKKIAFTVKMADRTDNLKIFPKDWNSEKKCNYLLESLMIWEKANIHNKKLGQILFVTIYSKIKNIDDKKLENKIKKKWKIYYKKKKKK